MQYILIPLLFLIASPAVAQSKSTDPIEVLTAADQAVGALKAFQYEGEAWSDGVMKNAVPPMKARILCQKGSAPHNAKIRIEIDDAGRKQLLICDGEKLFVQDRASGVYFSGNAADIERSDLYSLLFLAELTMEQPFEAERKEAKSVYFETARIDDQPTDVILSRYKVGDEARWYFDLKSHLPRKVVRQFRTPQSGVSTFHLKLSNFEENPEIPDNAFHAPEKPGRYKGLPVGWKVPDWTLRTPDGETVQLSKQRGRAVVLDFWAVWCAPCKKAMPGIQQIHKDFSDKPVDVYGISTWPRDTDPVAYMKDRGFTYGLLLDGDDVAEDYRVGGIPALYVIDGFGRVAFVGYGAGHDDNIRTAVEDSLHRSTPVPTDQSPGSK
ncbi:MAG: redoxin domain-containing protein [Phycisphaerae bacterium]